MQVKVKISLFESFKEYLNNLPVLSVLLFGKKRIASHPDNKRKT